jgi:hypothetical protein
VASLNPVTCRFIANLSRAQGSILSETGMFASATGTFRVDASITGVLPHNPGGGCTTSETSEPILDIVQGTRRAISTCTELPVGTEIHGPNATGPTRSMAIW